MSLCSFPSRRSPFVSSLMAALVASGGGCASSSEGEVVPPDDVPITCGQTAACPVSQPCLASFENAGAPRFALRMNELLIRSPATLEPDASLLGLLFWDAVLPSLLACLVGGTGATTWLLAFDLDHGTVTMGGAAPSHSETTPSSFSFLETTVTQGAQTFTTTPVTFDLVESASGELGTAAPEELDLPVFVFQGASAAVLPLHALSMSRVTVSASHDCIGRYDPSLFDVDAGCVPATRDEGFFPAGHLQAFVTLAEADAIVIQDLSATFCAILAGLPGMVGSSSTPVRHCPSSFQGDWCSTTNGPATASCADAVQLSADFAAGAVQLEN
jgi:hypothetical protein